MGHWLQTFNSFAFGHWLQLCSFLLLTFGSLAPDLYTFTFGLLALEFYFPTSLCGVLTFSARRPRAASPPPSPARLRLTHSLTHSLAHSLTHSHSLTHGSCLEGQDVVARAAGGVRNRGRRSTLAMPLRNCGRRSTLAMPLPKSWQAQHSVHLGVCLCGRGRIRQLSRGTGCCRARGGGCAKSWQAQHFGDAVAKLWQAQHFGDAVAEVVAGAAFCLEGQDVVARAAGGVRNRGRRSTLAMPLRNCGRRSTLAMPLPKSWQAQHSVHLGVCLCGRGRIRQLSRGTGCCRARGGGCAKSWQAQHFGDAVAKSWQAQHFGDAVAEVVAGAAFCASGCVFVRQGSHSAAV